MRLESGLSCCGLVGSEHVLNRSYDLGGDKLANGAPAKAAWDCAAWSIFMVGRPRRYAN
jgi:hypothetical protein